MLSQSELMVALEYIEALKGFNAGLPNGRFYSGGLRLTLPKVIPLGYKDQGQEPAAWLVEDASGGYSLSELEPNERE